MSEESGIEVLVRFAALASEAGAAATILPDLADALVQHIGADAVAILEIQKSGAVAFIPSPHLPPEIEQIGVEIDAIDGDLGRLLLSACASRFADVLSRPLVNTGGLFGSVIMLFSSEHPKEKAALAEGLIDLAAIALGTASQLQSLAQSHAELRASQNVLVRTEKLRALGQMAAGVSHDLKNILNPLSLHLQFMSRAMARGQSAQVGESIDEMKQVLVRGLQTIERLRDYSRQSPESRTEQVDLNLLLHEAKEIAKPRMASRGGASTRIREELGAPPAVWGRPGEIVSALVNLIVNAIDAMPNGGTITLRSGDADRGFWVEVADDGPGMPPEIQSRVFEPFFSTKGEAGTGLGLAMVYACMQRHGGSVQLETEPGKGTTFRLWFPKSLSSPPPFVEGMASGSE